MIYPYSLPPLPTPSAQEPAIAAAALAEAIDYAERAMNTVTAQSDGNAVTICLNGDFTFAVNADFRKSYKRFPNTSQFIVDLSQASYMDSAGLGMLIQLHDYAGGSDRANVAIVGCNDSIREILTIANFEKMFNYA